MQPNVTLFAFIFRSFTQSQTLLTQFARSTLVNFKYDVIFLVEPCGLFFVKKKCFGVVPILSWELISDSLVD